jgi:hypothetical protein
VPLIRIPAVNLRRQNPIRFFDDQGQVRDLPLLRLRVSIFIGKQTSGSAAAAHRLVPAILDTGAPITTFPKRSWQLFASEISRVQLAEDRALTGAIGGRRFGYFLGRVWVGAVDLWGRRLPAVPVLAQFREDDIPEEEPQPPILLGLWGGLLEGRSLTRWPITERYDADIPALESFGQWWRLADP